MNLRDVLAREGYRTKVVTVYHGREKLVPGTLDSVRSSKGIAVVLTIDSKEAGRQLFHLPVECQMEDYKTLRIKQLNQITIAANEWVHFDVIRLSIFRGGVYSTWMKLNGEKSVENISLDKGAVGSISTDQGVLYPISTYTMQLEAPNWGVK